MKKIIWTLLTCFIISAHAESLNKVPNNFAAFDLLYWQAREGGADNWAKTISAPGAQQTAQLADAPFPWKTGIRLSIGHFFHENSDVALAFTHYTTTATNQVSGIVYSSLDANYFANNTDGSDFGPSYSNANVRWQLFYNNLDVELGHNFHLDSLLQLHPRFGLEFASINQNIYTNWNNPTTTTTFTSASENLQNNFSGIGPVFGIDSLWSLYSGSHHSFNIVGNLTTALVWGQWTFKDVYNNNQPVTITVNSDGVNGLSPMIGGLLGVQWNMTLPTTELSIRLGYEEQVWLNQMQIYFLDTGKMNRSTTFQGANLQFKLTF